MVFIVKKLRVQFGRQKHSVHQKMPKGNTSCPDQLSKAIKAYKAEKGANNNQ